MFKVILSSEGRVKERWNDDFRKEEKLGFFEEIMAWEDNVCVRVRKTMHGDSVMMRV